MFTLGSWRWTRLISASLLFCAKHLLGRATRSTGLAREHLSGTLSPFPVPETCSFAPKICSDAPIALAIGPGSSWLLGRSKFACLQRQKPAMFAQMPLFVGRHFTGAVCATSSDGRFALFSAPSTAAFSVASRPSKSSDILLADNFRAAPTAVGRLLRAPGSKL